MTPLWYSISLIQPFCVSIHLFICYTFIVDSYYVCQLPRKVKLPLHIMQVYEYTCISVYICMYTNINFCGARKLVLNVPVKFFALNIGPNTPFKDLNTDTRCQRSRLRIHYISCTNKIMHSVMHSVLNPRNVPKNYVGIGIAFAQSVNRFIRPNT